MLRTSQNKLYQLLRVTDSAPTLCPKPCHVETLSEWIQITVVLFISRCFTCFFSHSSRRLCVCTFLIQTLCDSNTDSSWMEKWKLCILSLSPSAVSRCISPPSALFHLPHSMLSSPSIHPSFPLAFMYLHPSLHPSHLSILPPPRLSQYFDEEQDDHEYPYYYEETTGVPSSSAFPSPRPGAPSQQVKREQNRLTAQAGFVEGKENGMTREREVIKLYGLTDSMHSDIWLLPKFTNICSFRAFHMPLSPLITPYLLFTFSLNHIHTSFSTILVTQSHFVFFVLVLFTCCHIYMCVCVGLWPGRGTGVV